MPNNPQQTPRFRDPPVVETVLGVFFRPLANFNVAQRVLFWKELQGAFPDLEEKPPIDEVAEIFDESNPKGEPEIRWQVQEFPPVRLWAKSPDKRHTLQVQFNGLFVNWERSPNSSKYLTYEDRRKDFEEKLTLLNKFMGDSKIGSIAPSSAFVTYINHIEIEPPNELGTALSNLLMAWNDETSDGWLPMADSASLQFSYPMPNKQGRLHVSAARGFQYRENKYIIKLVLTARSSAIEAGAISAALDWLDLGHNWVVRGFASLTRPEMHDLWGRLQ